MVLRGGYRSELSRAPRRGKGQLKSTSNATERQQRKHCGKRQREQCVGEGRESHLDSKGTGKDQGWDRMVVGMRCPGLRGAARVVTLLASVALR